MTGWEAALLGVIQGLTEFLPVSSSGHLVLAKTIFGIKESGIAFEIFVHFGTLVAVVTVFKQDLWQLAKDLMQFIARESAGRNADNPPKSTGKPPMLAFLVVATLPAAILGYLFKDIFERFFSDPTFVSGALIITGILLLLTKFSNESPGGLSYGRALLIGIAQVGALFPGISRSGTTISAALLLGVAPLAAARFSFLLAVPLILGVSVVKVVELIAVPPSAAEVFILVLGSLFAYASGLVAIKWLLRVMERGRIDRFGYYCLAVGLLGLVILRLQAT